MAQPASYEESLCVYDLPLPLASAEKPAAAAVVMFNKEAVLGLVNYKVNEKWIFQGNQNHDE